MKKHILWISAIALMATACTQTEEMEQLLNTRQETTKAIEYETISVTLTTAGSLATQLGDNANIVEKLVISGPINAADVRTIRALPLLEAIDMSAATIKGGDETYEVGTDEYVLHDNSIGAYMLSGLKLSEIILPNSTKGIEWYAFSNMSGNSPLSMIIPEGVTLDSYVFSNCRNLVSVQLPSTLQEIPNGTFSDCSMLTSVTFSNNIISFGDASFYGCRSLNQINFPETLTTIGGLCFYHSGLTQISIPDNVQILGDGCFFYCTELISVKLPNGITTISGSMFGNCVKLTSIDIPESVENIAAPYEANPGAFEGCESLTNINLPDKLTNLGARAFARCSALRHVTLPSELRTIGDNCFYHAGITEIDIPENVSSIGHECFSGCGSLKELTIPQNVTMVGNNIVDNCTSLTVILWNTNIDVPPLTISTDVAGNFPNPNCLLYIANENIQVHDTYLKNIIYNGMAEEITISSACDRFNVPQEFKTKSIHYTQEFTMPTGINRSNGWETISLPFTVNRVVHEDGRILAPFNATVADEKPFWLRRLTASGFKNVTTLEANISYIIAMPHNDAYLPEYNIEGLVTFSAQDEAGITIPTTQITRDQGPDFILINTYEEIFGEEGIANNYYDLLMHDRFSPMKSYSHLDPFDCYAIPLDPTTKATSFPIESAAPTTRSAKPLGPVPSIDDM